MDSRSHVFRVEVGFNLKLIELISNCIEIFSFWILS
jgi:hypothetical protein